MEFGWRLLNCIEGPHFVVWGGDEAPKTQLGFLLLRTLLCPSDEFGPASFPERTLCLVLNFLPCLWYFSNMPQPYIYNFHVFTMFLTPSVLQKAEGWMAVLSRGKNMTFEIWREKSSTGDLAIIIFFSVYCVTSRSHFCLSSLIYQMVLCCNLTRL